MGLDGDLGACGRRDIVGDKTKLFVYLQVTGYGVTEMANSLAFAHARVADAAAAVDAVGCWAALAEGA